MNNKIPYTSVIARLSEITGLPKRQCEDYLREMISLISEQLGAREEIAVPRLGNFRIVRVNPRKSVDVSTGNDIEIAAHNKVNFTPTAALAEEVNELFSMFENQSLPDNFDESLLEANVTIAEEEKVKTNNDGDKADTSIKDGSQQENITFDIITGEDSTEDNGNVVSEYVLEESEQKNETDECITDTDTSKFKTEETPNEINEDIPGDNTEESSKESEEETLPESDSNSVNEISDNSETANCEEPENKIEEESVNGTGEEYITGNDAQYSDSYIYEKPVRKKATFFWGFVAGLVFAAIVVAFLYFTVLSDVLNKDKEVTAQIKDNEVAPITTVDSIDDSQLISGSREEENVADTRPSDMDVNSDTNIIKYDTISRTRYLTTMARDHYGNFNLWPYIYEENKDILGHPDRIRPGTPVRIPDLKKYGVDPKNPEDIAEAKRKGVAIYSRYK